MAGRCNRLTADGSLLSRYSSLFVPSNGAVSGNFLRAVAITGKACKLPLSRSLTAWTQATMPWQALSTTPASEAALGALAVDTSKVAARVWLLQ